MANINAKSLTRLILVKTISVILAVIFFAIGILFLVYPILTLATNQGGADAKIVQVSDHFHKVKTGCRVGGLFTVATASVEGQSSDNPKIGSGKDIYSLYPAFPDQLQPSKGDIIRVWPGKNPVFGSPIVEGWGWFIVGTLFVLGLVLLEFGFLALTVS